MSEFDGLLLSPDYLDALFERYQNDPSSVSPELGNFLRAQGNLVDSSKDRQSNENNGARRSQEGTPVFLTNSGGLPAGVDKHKLDPGIQIYDLIHTFRQFGHLIADIDPLGQQPTSHPFLELEEFGFTEADLDTKVACDGFANTPQATLQEYVDILKETYCGPIGVEFMDIASAEERKWLQARIEPPRNRQNLSAEKRRQLLHQIVQADTFEESLGRMYVGAKRFSLEGGTTLITLLQTLVEESSTAHDIEQIVIGMAHRGRLNVLAHVLQKPLKYMLAEFEERPQASTVQGYGDVKYHLGYSYDFEMEGGHPVHLSLAFNPSHLEAINPVIEGIVRAKQDRYGDGGMDKSVPVLVHGDAAFVGQGVVSETLVLGGLEGYKTGGTIHIIVNNQVGFTASPTETRSTLYASDAAKIARAPVFHVNADHPEAVHLVAQVALAYRQRFHKDVVIDLVCFRRHGHNELDDASYTQPVMSKLISQHGSVSRIYADKICNREPHLPKETREEMEAEVREQMAEARKEAKTLPEQFAQGFGGLWKGIKTFSGNWDSATAVDKANLDLIANALSKAPENFHWHKRLQKLVNQRTKQILGGDELDWACGEALALGSLLLEGTHVRFSGQDAGRGTFSHRHAIYSDQHTGQKYVPLNNISEDQAPLDIINSPLSEFAALGFEYGYAAANPWSLVVWEAQFGDFVNGAQVIIDQLITSAEHKWGRMCGLVMLLPHGYEGQGPEHSSARLERFLELCAENNLQVCNLSTPSQIFHALRRQIHRDFRKPLVVMSPKSLLRHPLAKSPIADFTSGQFLSVIDDEFCDAESVDRVLLCSGKIYYSLHTERQKRNVENVAIVRLEQIYPYPLDTVRGVLSQYPNAKKLVWVQEEPRNMGAWRNIHHRLESSLSEGMELLYVGRDSRAVPASGSHQLHQAEEQTLVDAALSVDSTNQVVRRGRMSKNVLLGS